MARKPTVSMELEEQFAIARLMYEYARCADKKDYKGFARVFAEDAVFEYRGEAITPRSAIVQLMHNLDSYSVTQHRVQNILYEIEGDVASGETYCLASHLHESDSAVVKIDMAITYADQLRRTDQGWRIAHRVFNLLWTQTGPVDSP